MVGGKIVPGKFPEFRNIAAKKENEEDPYIIFDRDDRHMFTLDNEAVRIARDFSATPDA